MEHLHSPQDGANSNVPDFDTLWRQLRDMVGNGLTIQTLRDQRPNRLEWVGDAIRVTTGKGSIP